ncbi:MAG: bifunctional acetate--CoA ligase family protein/GNAT family N-acetyltransferase [Dongiaceae bacterium]
MTIRNLDGLLAPRAVALIGATPQPGHVGNVVLRNLRAGRFAGPVLPVNPHYAEIDGLPCYASVEALPEAPDLAIIATPAPTVPGLVAQLAARGTKAAAVISAGFGGAAGGRLRQAMLDAARPALLRILGPNSLGLLLPRLGLNASSSHLQPAPGRIAFVAQSAGVLAAVLDWAAPRGIGFSKLVSAGDVADVDTGDLLDYLATDPDTTSVLLYLEAVVHPRKFMSAARAAARTKPVIVVKAGRHSGSARAVASHTGAMAGADAVYDAAFRRAGMLRVLEMAELFAAVEALGTGRPPAGERLAILTNGGGIGILASDALLDLGGRLAELAPATLAALDAVLPAGWSQGNPVDIVGDAPPERYRAALGPLLADPGADGVLVLNAPTALASGSAAAAAVAETAGGVPDGRRHCLLTSWVGEATAGPARRLFAEHGIPSYETPELAVRAFMHLAAWRRNQEMLLQTPPSYPTDFVPDRAAARAVIAAALADGRGLLGAPDAQAVLRAYGIPGLPVTAAADPDAAAAAAAAIGGPVVLKILSPDIAHKSEVGGVRLELEGPAAVRSAASEMLAQVAAQRPDARLAGVTVEPMVRRRYARELIIGMSEDPQFGPVMLFGAGGVAVELLGDRALALPPLNLALAREMIGRTRVSRLLAGHRDRPAADLAAVALTLVQLSQLTVDFPEILTAEINPLLADPDGVLALDARIRVGPAPRPGSARLAIRPYPSELEEPLEIPGLGPVLLRPIRPEDEPALRDLVAAMSPHAVRMRFFAPLKELSHGMAARLTQIDYEREMALVLADPGPAGTAALHGVVRLMADPDGESAEYAIALRDALTGHGIGTMLMRRIIDYARGRGIGEIHGDVLAENRPMLEVARALGFHLAAGPYGGEAIRVSLRLRD